MEFDNLVWNTKKIVFNSLKHFNSAIPGGNCSFTKDYVWKTLEKK